jgi:hypothetical protein
MNPTPAITFSVDLSHLMNEKLGPITNEAEVAVSELDSNYSTNASTWLPTLTVSPNHKLKHGDTFVAYGQRAIYLRDMYGVGYAPSERAYLVIESVV